jgi:hypothetical protein
MNNTVDTPVLQRKGSVHKCPSCGASLGAFVSVCGTCDHELLDVDANRSITQLAERFEDIEREVEGMGYKGKRRDDAITEKKGRVIRDFPVPNSRDDLQQLIYYIQPKIVPSVKPDPNIEDWRVKFTEVLNRARQAYQNDDATLRQLESMAAATDASLSANIGIKARRNPLFFALLGGALLVGAGAAVSGYLDQNRLDACEKGYSQSAAVEKARLDKLAAAVEQDLHMKDYAAAQAKASAIRWELASSCKAADNARAKAGWQERAQQLAALVSTSANADQASRQQQAQREADERQAQANNLSAERVAQEARLAEGARIKALEKHADAARGAGEKRKATLEQQW